MSKSRNKYHMMNPPTSLDNVTSNWDHDHGIGSYEHSLGSKRPSYKLLWITWESIKNIKWRINKSLGCKVWKMVRNMGVQHSWDSFVNCVISQHQCTMTWKKMWRLTLHTLHYTCRTKLENHLFFGWGDHTHQYMLDSIPPFYHLHHASLYFTFFFFPKKNILH